MNHLSVCLANYLRRKLMMMPLVFGDGITITRVPNNPTKAYVMGGPLPQSCEMDFGAAEELKDSFVRSKLGFEPEGDVPPRQNSASRNCRQCHRPSDLRCSACRTSYCSRKCQVNDWKAHVFRCCVKGRPNDVDNLCLVTRRWVLASRDENFRSEMTLALFSDDNLCKTFGFNNCINDHEVANLVCIYNNLLRSFRPVDLQHLVNQQLVGKLIQDWIEDSSVYDSNATKCSCIPWYLNRCSKGFDIPNPDGDYAYQHAAIYELKHSFSLNFKNGTPRNLSDSQKSVASLFLILLRDFNNIPDVYTPEWINFGFCFCRDPTQRQALAAAYLKLAENRIPLSQIATAWETSSLLGLMRNQGIDISMLESNAIYPQRPHVDDFGIYRLISEIKHALSGYYCPCFQSPCQYHFKYETFLSKESEGNYGFHGVHVWERWQLMNFYSFLFEQPDFDARKMQEARRHPDAGALDEYIGSIVPDFQRKIWHDCFADAMFPKLKSRMECYPRWPQCECIIHRTIKPEGLDLLTSGNIYALRERMGGGNHERNQ